MIVKEIGSLVISLNLPPDFQDRILSLVPPLLRQIELPEKATYVDLARSGGVCLLFINKEHGVGPQVKLNYS